MTKNTTPSTVTIGSLTLHANAKADDGSYLASANIGEIVQKAISEGKTAVQATEKAEGSTRQFCYTLAALVAAHRDKDDRIIWNRGKQTEAYTLAEAALFDAIIPPVAESASQLKQDERAGKLKRFRDAVKTAWSVRGVVDDSIFRHACDTLTPPLTPEERDGFVKVSNKTGGVLLVDGETMPDRLMDAIRNEYEHSGLKLPTAFGGKKGQGSSTGGQGSGQKQTPAEAVSVLTTKTASGTYGLDSAAEALDSLVGASMQALAKLTNPKAGHGFPMEAVLTHWENASDTLNAGIDYLTRYTRGVATADDREAFLAVTINTLSEEDAARLANMVGTPEEADIAA